MDKVSEFGEEIKQKEFNLKEGITFVNHGSFGVVPRRIQEAQRRILEEINSYPDIFYRHNVKAKLKEARECMADFVNADPEDVVFVENASTGINTVLKSLSLVPGDIILCTDNAYESVKYACRAAVQCPSLKGVKAEFLSLKFPITNEDDVVQIYREYFRSQPNVKFAILDHVTSPSALRMPLGKLIPLCKEFGIMTMIDGAHAPGHIKIDLKHLDPDIYTGNLHKWLFSPRGCCFLYVNKKHQDWVSPLLVSHGYQKGFQINFFSQGTRDESPYCVVPEAIKFFNDIGGHEKIQEYTNGLLNKATDLLTSSWKTEKLPVPKSMEVPCMRLVQLPKLKCFTGLSGYDELETVLIDNILQNKLSAQYFYIEGKVYIRLSACVYNTLEDYKTLCRFICDQMEENC